MNCLVRSDEFILEPFIWEWTMILCTQFDTLKGPDFNFLEVWFWNNLCSYLWALWLITFGARLSEKNDNVNFCVCCLSTETFPEINDLWEQQENVCMEVRRVSIYCFIYLPIFKTSTLFCFVFPTKIYIMAIDITRDAFYMFYNI